MDITDLIIAAQGEEGLARIGGQFGLDAAQTRAAVETLAPALAAGVRRNMATPDGLAGLLGALAGGNHASYLETRELAYEQVKPEGDAILGHVFGSKDVSRAVAMQAASSTGLSDSILKKMLPIIAPMVLGAIVKMFTGGGQAAEPQPQARPRSGGGLGDILGDILGGGSARGSSGGGLGDVIGDILGGGSRRSAPSGGGGLGDIIGDILGGGARRAPEPEPEPRQAPSPSGGAGGGLDDLIRDILGGGGQSRPQDPADYPGDHPYRRSRDVLEDMLGRGTPRGDAGEELLNSVERRLREM